MNKHYWRDFFERRAAISADPVFTADWSQSGFAIRYRFIRHTLKRIARPNFTLLDGGCGVGSYLELGKNMGMQVIGVDLSRAMLGTAVRKGLSCCRGDIENLPIAGKSCDLIISVGVMQYLENASRCLFEFSRVLKPGGHVILTTLNQKSIRAIIVKTLGIDNKRAYLLSELIHEAHSCGMILEEARYLYFFPVGLGFLAKILNLHDGLNRGCNLLANAVGVVLKKPSYHSGR